METGDRSRITDHIILCGQQISLQNPVCQIYYTITGEFLVTPNRIEIIILTRNDIA